MNNIEILDCTLRDGGFINNWEFGKDCIINIVERLSIANIDIIEIGYLREKAKEDVNSTQFPNTKFVNNLIPKHVYEKTKIVAILDFGACSIDNIYPASECHLHGIRLTFKRSEIDSAFSFAEKLQSKGYEVYIQPVNIMDYSSSEILNLTEKSNKINPASLCLVDTYGFMDKRDLVKRFYLLDSNLAPQIKIGYHSHNNFQLAYSNSVELIDQHTKRNIILDTSVFGMGKGAGNANTELIAYYINQRENGKYDIDQLLEIADIYIEKEREKHFWGYTLLYYIAAAVRVHHSYVKFLLDKKTLSVKSIKEILVSLDEDKKTSYDEEHIIKKYNEYQSVKIDDKDAYSRLKNDLTDKKILLVAPGKSLINNKEKINNFIQKNNMSVICINHISDIVKCDYIFVGSSKRYSQIAYQQVDNTMKVIATSNITPASLHIDYTLNYSDLIDTHNALTDSSGMMIIQALIKLGIKEIYLAGFDGFKGHDDYIHHSYELQSDNSSKNTSITNIFENYKKQINIKFVTPSLFGETHEI